ncbi:hypothetical protein GIB67_033733 [Kingdonia uniflora]|uniref:Auxin efflux carrier family protein n=1 Tax=Kingdonia uniflora TaxID=39325 RepID=A0A7J7P430_9MAGN|nr:hypothetical protein GIB67_033733 [Kingdonia uniflora]
MGILDLFVAASIPVLEVLLVTAVGSVLALERVNILGEVARKHFNNVVFYVFSPSLIAANLAKTLTYDSMVTLWFMPLNILFTYIIGSALGLIVVQITRTPSHLRGLVLGCCAAGNLGNMLLIIIPAVCKEKSSPFGAPDLCHEYGMGYSSLSMAIGAIYLWSYVYNIVRISSTGATKEDQKNVFGGNMKLPEETSKLLDDSPTEALLPIKDCSLCKDCPCQLAFPCTPPDEVPIVTRFKQQLTSIAGKINLKRLFAPSTIGAVFGFFVGVVPQIRWLMIGDDAPFRVIQDSTLLLGDGAIPALTLLVGANLVKGLKGSGIHTSVVLGIIVVRYILLPLTGVAIVKGAIKFGFINSDPLYQFILMLQYALPPAMNIGTMTQLFGEGESECSVIMLWTYSLASIALTIWSTYFMWLVS